MTDDRFEKQPYREQRQKDAMMRRIRFQDGCWIWTGELNYAGTPIVRLGADAVAAIDAVWQIWLRRTRPPAARPCPSHELCVNPNDWKGA